MRTGNDMRRAAIIVISICTIATVGCKDNYRSILKGQVSTLDDIAKVLTRIRDKKSAEEAKPKLKKLGDEWRLLKRRMRAIRVTDKIREKSKDVEIEYQALMMRLSGDSIRVSLIPGGKEALKAMGDLTPYK